MQLKVRRKKGQKAEHGDKAGSGCTSRRARRKTKNGREPRCTTDPSIGPTVPETAHSMKHDTVLNADLWVTLAGLLTKKGGRNSAEVNANTRTHLKKRDPGIRNQKNASPQQRSRAFSDVPKGFLNDCRKNKKTTRGFQKGIQKKGKKVPGPSVLTGAVR